MFGALSGIAHLFELWNPGWPAPLQVQEISNLFQQAVDGENIYCGVLAN